MEKKVNQSTRKEVTDQEVTTGNYQKEIEDLKEYLEESSCLDPKIAQYELARIFMKTKEYREAIKYFKLSFANQKPDAIFYCDLGEAYLGLNDINSALRQLEIIRGIENKSSVESENMEAFSNLIKEKLKSLLTLLNKGQSLRS
jgi:tetratricopeptide (TPR) repeat protein